MLDVIMITSVMLQTTVQIFVSTMASSHAETIEVRFSYINLQDPTPRKQISSLAFEKSVRILFNLVL